MINPTIETDLVGETVLVERLLASVASIPTIGPYPARRPRPGQPSHRSTTPSWYQVVTGRVRAVTVSGDGQLMLWIEVVDASAVRAMRDTDLLRPINETSPPVAGRIELWGVDGRETRVTLLRGEIR